jgi:type IV pilus assembly protein PilC
MVKSGEASGHLSETLVYLAEHLEKDYQLNSKLRGAMIYPAFILGTLFMVGLVMIFYVLPQLIGVLKEMGQELPLLTKIIIGVADFLRTKGYLLLFFLAAAIFFGRRYLKTKEGKRLFDKISLKVPILGDFFKMINLARFAENLSTLISGGLPIAQALEITREVVGNTLYKEMIFETQEAVRRGETISSVLTKYSEIVPPLVTQMTVVGERTGQLDNTLKNVVDFYQKEVERGVDNLVSLIEPVLIICLGLVIGLFVAGVLLPLYNLGGMGI